jgi:hypothetical protein
MQAWMSWAAFLAIAAAAYFYYAPKAGGDVRGRSTTRPATTTSWSDSETKPKTAPKQVKAKAKAPRKSINAAVQEAGNKAEAAFEAATSTGAEVEPVASTSAGASKAPSGRDVSDMLGAQGAAPSVLSIKASDKPARASKAKAPKVEAQETKKQRQNRQKVEAQKIAREEEEKQRQVLMEKQRRTAREARGEPAKNGVQAATAPSNNPWTVAGAVQAPPSASAGQLLDTFDAASTTSSSEAPTNGTIQTPDSTSNSGSYNGLPSEEEQLRLAMEDSAWTTIPKGGKKQRVKTAGEIAEEGNVFTPVQQPVKSAQAPQAKKAENRAPTSRYQILSETFTAKDHPQDSDWPVV